MIGRTAAILVPLYLTAALATALVMAAACSSGCGTEPGQLAEAAFYAALWPVFWFQVTRSLDPLPLLLAGILVACVIFLLGIRGARR